MKRLQLLILVAAIAAGAIWWSFYRSRHTSSVAVTSLLPKETLAFAHLPDFNRSRTELRQTDLYQIWAEPTVQEFLQKPRSKIPANLGLDSILQDCESIQMKDLFLAVVAIENSAWKIVGGFRFKGDPANADKVVASWKSRLLGKASESETVDYKGHPIQIDRTGILRLSSVRSGQWFFVANDPELLKPILERTDHGVQDMNVTLAADSVFSVAAKRMPSIYNALGFARVDQLVEKLQLDPIDNTDSPKQMAVVRQIRSICGATSIDGGKIRDSIFIGMPKLVDAGSLTRGALPVATNDTFLYGAGFLNLSKPLPIANSPVSLGWLGGVQQMLDALSTSGVTLETWNKAFGPEFSWVGNWASGSHWPLVFATLPVKDPAKAKEILKTITATNDDSMDWTEKEKDGVHYFSTRANGQLFSMSPTIGLSDKMLIVGASANAIEAAMKRLSSGSSELAASKAFKIAERTVPPAEQMFTYVDPTLIYSRIDATLRPMLFWGAAVLPGIADTVDLSKWPAPEAITKHLSPIVMSQRYDGDGYISESVGPLTFYQSIVGVGTLGGAAAVMYQNRMHRFSNPFAGAIPAPSSPSSTAPAASASPEDSPE